MPVLNERATAVLIRLQATLDEMERLGKEARELMAELQDDGQPCSRSVRDRTRDALRQLREADGNRRTVKARLR